MHGNVWEWVEDVWHDRYKGAPTDGSTWTDGKGGLRVFRGGSWYLNRRRPRRFLVPQSPAPAVVPVQKVACWTA